MQCTHPEATPHALKMDAAKLQVLLTLFCVGRAGFSQYQKDVKRHSTQSAPNLILLGEHHLPYFCTDVRNPT